MSPRTALVTGVTGQDGSYLAELLLREGYRVCGLVRPGGPADAPRLRATRGRVELIPLDLLDQAGLADTLRRLRPAEIYNLAAMTFVPTGWEQPARVIEFTTLAVTRLLEAVRQTCPEARVFQAGSSEMFGAAAHSPQGDGTPFCPRSPYGVAKACAHQVVAGYRAAFGLFACSGVLFNHESPRRGLEFVTRKITHGAAKVKLGLARELRLGNLAARRDWGHARDYVRAMWLMLQQAEADDYVIGTGETHAVEEFVAAAFDHVGLDWREHVVVDPQFYRPVESSPMVADPGKARARLHWSPQVRFEELVREMVEADLAALAQAPRPAARCAG
jgi:GDPmannose 4,6-dehydratase